MAPAPRRPPSLRGSAQRDQFRQRGDDTVAHRITVGRGYAPDTPPTAGRGYAPDASHNRGMHDRTQGPRIGGSPRDPRSEGGRGGERGGSRVRSWWVAAN